MSASPSPRPESWQQYAPRTTPASSTSSPVLQSPSDSSPPLLKSTQPYPTTPPHQAPSTLHQTSRQTTQMHQPSYNPQVLTKAEPVAHVTLTTPAYQQAYNSQTQPKKEPTPNCTQAAFAYQPPYNSQPAPNVTQTVAGYQSSYDPQPPTKAQPFPNQAQPTYQPTYNTQPPTKPEPPYVAQAGTYMVRTPASTSTQNASPAEDNLWLFFFFGFALALLVHLIAFAFLACPESNGIVGKRKKSFTIGVIAGCIVNVIVIVAIVVASNSSSSY